MAYRSWLKDVRKVDDLAKFLHAFPKNHDKWGREEEIAEKGYGLLKNRDLPVDTASNQYFGGGLHDGFVAGVLRQDNRIEITITDRDLDDFMEEEILSPVRLVFEGVTYANAARHDDRGWLKWSDWSKWRSLEDTRCSDTLSRDWFYQEGGKIQWIGEFQKFESVTSSLSSDIYVVIDCERAYAIPESEKALRQKLGDESYEDWQKINRFDRGNYHS